MKKIIVILAVVFLSALAVLFITKSFIALAVAKGQLQSIFPKSEISISGCAIDPLRKLSFSGIKIKREKVYEFDIKEAGINYNLAGIFKRNIAKAYLKDARINITLGQKSVLEFNEYLNLSSPNIFIIRELQLTNVALDLKAKEVSLAMKLSAGVDLFNQEVKSLDARAESLESQGVFLKEVVLKVAQEFPQGEFSIQQASYDKANVGRVKARADLKGKDLSFSELTTRLFDGEVNGEARVVLMQNPEYSASLKFSNLDMERFIKDFKLEEKFQMTGKLSGNIVLKGQGADLRIIEGDLWAGEAGGIMVVKDDTVLKNMARGSNQPLDILVESFKDYHYNTGVMKLSKKQEDLIMDIALDGEKGKRSLTVTLHDFAAP
jgi:hypothetical protein